MHILICSQQWYPEQGIAQRRLEWITRSLIEAGNTVSVITAPPHYPEGKLDSTAPEHQPGSRYVGPYGEDIWRTSFREHDIRLQTRIADQAVIAASSLRVAEMVVAEKVPDLVLASAPPLPSIGTAWRIARHHRAPFIVDLRDAWPDMAGYVGAAGPDSPKVSWKRHALGSALRVPAFAIEKIIRRADGLITTTESFGDEAARRWHKPTYLLRNLHVTGIPNPVMTAPVDDDTLKIVYSGTIGRAQGLMSAIEAVEICVNRRVPIRMTLNGTGAHVGALKEFVARRDLPVDLHGRIPREDALRRYSNADTILVHLQDWKPLEHTVPSKLYEAIGSGRHVSLAANGESAALLRESGAGDAVPAMDQRALADLWTKLQGDRTMLDRRGLGQAWLATQKTPEQEIEDLMSFLRGFLRDRP